ncbi:cellulose biosynthesis cyclic di-GMP-binding regulatory protein BcsB [Phormidium tenue FACHB-886]|nr:cellulose biosynthesis cyclic di-GMP-binding regulatory protein BcsB [Phormidium tenue FACHB-886]
MFSSHYLAWVSNAFRRLRTLSARRVQRLYALLGLFCLLGLGLAIFPHQVSAQSNSQTVATQPQTQTAPQVALPTSPATLPLYQPLGTAPALDPSNADTILAQATDPPSPTETPSAGSPRRTISGSPTDRDAAPTNRYVMDFNRSPVVGNRLRLQGIYAESRIGFTRPRGWEIGSARTILRFQHSPTLLGDRSTLTVRVNDTSIGSVKLDRPNSEIAEATFEIPAKLLQDYNEISMLASQQTSETCTNPADPTLWTEILPDSKVQLDYRAQATQLNFNRYPFPFLDELSLDANQLTYLRPRTLTTDWLTAVSQYQVSAGRLLEYRPLETRTINALDQVKPGEKLVMIGTPAEQPALANLKLPYPVRNSRLLDGKKTPLPDDVGVLMLTTAESNAVPVLVATGNSPAGVRKAVQFLVQSKDAQIGTGQAIIVSSVTEVATPAPRNWIGFLPTENKFRLSDLAMANRQPYQDITVRGTNALPIRVDFHALPDDRFVRGSTVKLNYSYSPQVNPRTSAVEVKLDEKTIASKALTSSNGGRESFTVELPPDLVTPDSKLGVQFILRPTEAGRCGLEAEQQLWSTLHADTSFDLRRDNVVRLPDLKLLQVGYPVTAPQDLSATVIALPDSPTNADLATLLAFSERMGRLTRYDAVKLQTYLAKDLPQSAKTQQNLVGIGTRERFPFPEVFQTAGLSLQDNLVRLFNGSQAQAQPDTDGMVKEVISPWNRDHLLIALTGQTDQGLRDVQDLFRLNPLFSRIQGDTMLVSRNTAQPVPYDSSGYTLRSLQQTSQSRLENTDWLTRLQLFLQDNWFLIPVGIVAIALLLYSMSQLFLNRVAE